MGGRFLQCLPKPRKRTVRHIHHFVIRVYRREADVFAGLLEDVQTGRAKPFQSIAELCELLVAHKPGGRRPARSAPAKTTPKP
jgi:hypothetical protein